MKNNNPEAGATKPPNTAARWHNSMGRKGSRATT